MYTKHESNDKKNPTRGKRTRSLHPMGVIISRSPPHLNNPKQSLSDRRVAKFGQQRQKQNRQIKISLIISSVC